MMNTKKPSKFMLGTVQLGLDYGMANHDGQPDHDQAFRILDTAWENGVNAFDTASHYGTSEQVVGDWLRARKHPAYVVSKFKLFSDDPMAELEEQIVESRRRLGAISGYMFHDADQMRRYQALVRPRLERMKQEDGLDFIGASVYTKEDVESFLEFGWMGAIQIPMSVLDNRIVTSGLLDELHKRGVLVFVRSVFLQGMLCMDRPPERFDFMIPSLDALREVARQEGMTLTQLAVSYIRDLPGVDSLVLGCEKPEQVRDNAALIQGPALSAKAMDAIAAIGPTVPMEHCMEVIRQKKHN